MESFGIDTRLIRVVPDMFTPQCFITTDLDNNQIASFHPGAMARSAENDLTGTQAAWAIVAPDAKEGMFAHAERLHAQNTPFIFRSEEHTSELQSLMRISYAVFFLKKKKNIH